MVLNNGEEVTACCPSVFGVYPVMGESPGWVNLSDEPAPVWCEIKESRWEDGRFSLVLSIAAEEREATLRFSGGASTPRSLSQSLLSQCMEVDIPGRASGVVLVDALVDFLFDQIVQDTMRGLFRQQEGVGQSSWISVAEIQELFVSLGDRSLLLGEVLRHPAAHLASIWNSASPLGGVAGRLSSELAGILSEAEPHFRAGGAMVLGPTVFKGPGGGDAGKVCLPEKGWIMTGRRGGVEAAARALAKDQGRPLIVVTKQEEAARLLRPDLFTSIVVDRSKKPLGSFRKKMMLRLQDSGSITTKPVTA